jgi:polysaccharide export outer membrane protein
LRKNILIIFFTLFYLFIFIQGVGAQMYGIPTYKVGINDVIDIKVLNHNELSITATVSSDGTIAYPYLGAIYVKDKTLKEIEEEITNKLSEGFVKFPVVTVSLLKSLSRKIFVYGEVLRKGEFQYEEGMTLEKALSLVGGPTKEGLFGKIIVRRKSKDGNGYKDIVEVPLDNGFILNKNLENFPLKFDDILKVERNKTFLIEGEVVRRGRFELEKDMTVLRALLQAGGVTENGLYGKVKVRRKQAGFPGGYKDIAESKLKEGIIDDKDVEDLLLQPDDILIVERNKTYFIYGEVNAPGEYVLKENITVFKAVILAGGLTKWGSEGRIKVLRQADDNSKFVEIKVDIDDVIKGNADADVKLRPGDTIIVSSGIF